MAPPPGSSSNPPSSSSSSVPVPKILLAKPPSTSESNAAHRRPPIGSLNLLSDSWDLLPDRVLPFLTENTDFTVIGVIGPTGVGKSTILNAIYGYDGNLSGMLPPFPVQTEETRALARHCSVGLELRVSHERLILLDTQPMFSTSILMDMMRPDGSSNVSLNNSEALSADLVHEMMCIQIGVFLASICHVLLVVSEGVHDLSMWKLMTTIDLLKHGIPDPSSLTPSYSQGSNMGSEKENKGDILQDACVEYLTAPVFVHTKLRDEDPSPLNTRRMKKMLSEYFRSSSFAGTNYGDINRVQICSGSNMSDPSSSGLKLFLLPNRSQDDSQRAQYESYATSLGKLRDQVLSMNCQPFAKPVSEREWLRNSARVWDTVKNSPVIAEYCKMLQNSEPVFPSDDENSDIESQIPVEISQLLEDHSKEENPNLKAEEVPELQGGRILPDFESQIPEISQSLEDQPKEKNPYLKAKSRRRRKRRGPKVTVPTLLKRDHSRELTEEEIEWLKAKELAGSPKRTTRKKYSEMSFGD